MSILNLPRGAYSLYIYNQYKAGCKKILAIAENEFEANLLNEQLAKIDPQINSKIYPNWDIQPYDRVSPNTSVMAERIYLLTSPADIVITTLEALKQKVLNPEFYLLYSQEIKIGTKVSQNILITNLLEIGYNRVSLASEVGDIAVRGGIIDVVANENYGYRIDMFGDEVDNIKTYNLATQLSIEKINSISILPVNEVVLSKDSISKFREQYIKNFTIGHKDPLYEAISTGAKYQGMENWLPLFYDEKDLISPITVFKGYKTFGFNDLEAYDSPIQEAYDLRIRMKNHEDIVYNPVAPSELWQMGMVQNIDVVLSEFGETPTDIRPSPVILNNDKSNLSFLKELKNNREISRIAICCNSEGSREKMHEILQSHDIVAQKIDNIQELSKLSPKTLGLLIIPFEVGFIYQNQLFIAEEEILGYRIRRKNKKISSKNAENFIFEAQSLNPGELVVHQDYGIGRFMGLETITIQSADHDCVKIVYAGDDKLYIPVENIDLLSRYGAEDGVQLDRLGAASWQMRKAKLKNRIKIEADAIIKVAAERATRKANEFDLISGMYDEFCARFPYPETEDQLAAIEDVIADLKSGKPMDRLICGDVGFGKTEVALRAAFAVASHKGSQVAVVVPTTLLARQHYKNFSRRFSDLGINVKLLSRLITPAEAKKVKEGLKDGSVDIVIGTHALLAKTISFNNLSLLIIDEEQHFGVVQKERLKEMRENVHVLTLSATPIPRTLNMALSGLRDLSIIATPPVDRIVTKTFVTPFDAVTIREAILNEKSRGGRTFFVCPRISDIEEVSKKLNQIVPEAKYKIAHGQMKPDDIDDIMNGFYDGDFDILLSTTIVESGLDVPSANTILIYRADILGLSQLYQLRGRVGRGKIKAFAYLITPKVNIMTPEARKRLEVMHKIDSLGAGFTVASHDMDIRGFGNLLGDEQSGNIREVGIELYQQMLTEAISAIKENKQEEPIHEHESPQINIGLSVLIPDTYVTDINLRLNLYRRIAALTTKEDLDSFYSELIDRFGPMPETVKHLFTIIEIKQMCVKAGIAKLDTGPKGVVLSFYGDKPKNPDKILNYIAKNGNSAKLRPDGKFVVQKDLNNDEIKAKFIKILISSLL